MGPITRRARHLDKLHRWETFRYQYRHGRIVTVGNGSKHPNVQHQYLRLKLNTCIYLFPPASSTPTTIRCWAIPRSIYRRKVAREFFVERARQVYEKVYDEETNTYFYYNKLHGTSKWTVPRALLGQPIDPRVSESSARGKHVPTK